MANGYDAHSMDASGLKEASSSAMPTVAVRDKRYTKNGIGWRSQEAKESTTLNPGPVGQNPPPIMYGFDNYPGGVAGRVRGAIPERAASWEKAQEATSPQIKPRDTLPAGLNENWDGFPCEEDARMALAVLSQFVDGETVQSLQGAIEDQFGDPSEMGSEDDEDGVHMMPDGSYMRDDEMDEAAISEAPLNAEQRNKLPDSAFALPGRKYPIDSPERARSALARVEQFGSDSDKRRVRAAVKKRYPNMDVE